MRPNSFDHHLHMDPEFTAGPEVEEAPDETPSYVRILPRKTPEEIRRILQTPVRHVSLSLGGTTDTPRTTTA